MLEKFFEVPSILLFEPGMLLPFVMLGLLINSHLLPLRKIGELTEILFPLPFFISWQKLMPWKKSVIFQFLYELSYFNGKGHTVDELESTCRAISILFFFLFPFIPKLIWKERKLFLKMFNEDESLLVFVIFFYPNLKSSLGSC